jgi:hypothetical protein
VLTDGGVCVCVCVVMSAPIERTLVQREAEEERGRAAALAKAEALASWEANLMAKDERQRHLRGRDGAGADQEQDAADHHGAI